MSRRVIACVLLVCFSAVAHAQQTRSSTADRLLRLEATINRSAADFMSNACHVGLSIAIVKENETRFYNYGSVSREAQKTPDDASLYEIASVTKTFTGALAAQAVVRQRMRLDSDFRTYLPQQYPNLASGDRSLTLRTLATHRSGLPRDLPDTDDLYAHPDFERLPYELIARDSGYDRSRYLRELHAVHLRTEPGSTEAYSNLGIKVIGLGLETVYGSSFEKLMQKEILDPLHMTSTGFAHHAKERRRWVVGYSRGGHSMPYHLRNAGAAYGLYSTTGDMAKYIRWQLDESDPAVHLAHAPLRGDNTNGEALIWNVTMEQGSRLLWHGGGTFGMTSQVVLFPDDHEGYVLLANDACQGTEGALRDMAIKAHDSP